LAKGNRPTEFSTGTAASTVRKWNPAVTRGVLAAMHFALGAEHALHSTHQALLSHAA
jgi:hypothetical protein